jgi:hypothetical protein
VEEGVEGILEEAEEVVIPVEEEVREAPQAEVGEEEVLS